MFAAIFALKALNRRSSANVYTDSKYLQEGIKFWIHKWRQNNWRNSSNKPVVNQDLWMRLQELVEVHHVHWMWVRGHSTDRFNNFVDLLARQAISRKSGLDMKFRMHEFEEIIDGRQIPWKN